MSKKILFSRKVKCAHCGGNFKSKLERGKRRVYVCSKYDNFGKCERVPIEQDFVLELLERRYGEKLELQERVEKVVRIIVEEKMKFTIELEDDAPIIFSDHYIQF